MVDVEVPVSYQLSTPSDGGPGIGNATMNDFTPRAQQVLVLARKKAERFNHNYVGTEHLSLGLIKLGQGRSSQCAGKDGARSGEGSHGGGEACRFASRDKHDWEHSVYAASQKGIGISSQRGQSVKSLLRRYRTHFAGTLAGRRGSRRTGYYRVWRLIPRE